MTAAGVWRSVCRSVIAAGSIWVYVPPLDGPDELYDPDDPDTWGDWDYRDFWDAPNGPRTSPAVLEPAVREPAGPPGAVPAGSLLSR
ncbi:hypothetical protein [Streptomyces sp. H27-D2]|uniref:hypothetical protein n=1 Tax=Streptomyces sp. H27-D2 TaxID=3046304 RepID=UPI002DBCD923|nr:hypothetical protein [Streptomyces sp. H27-D2]MEC4016144.1 hypothetical protein [Streptomyces sp. H27-D2]